MECAARNALINQQGMPARSAGVREKLSADFSVVPTYLIAQTNWLEVGVRASWNELDVSGRGGIGRRACLRCMYPEGCGGSSPLDRTIIIYTEKWGRRGDAA